MPDTESTVVRNRTKISETEYHAALIAGIARVASFIGRGNLCDKWGRTPRMLGKLFAGDSLDTSGKGLLDLLDADPSVLDEVLSLYGYGLHKLPDANSDGDDQEALSRTIEFAAEQSKVVGGPRNHKTTISLAEKARPVAAYCHTVIAAAGRFRGLAA